jgi:hypothetical protein
MNSQSQILNFSDASYENSNSNNEKLYYTPIKSMIHKFLEAPKIMDYDNTMYTIAPSQHFHLPSLFLNKHLEKLKFSTLFYDQL